MTVHMLTTTDNPFNPFTHFKEWNTWDMSHGYHTLAYLARVVVTSDELSEAQQIEATEHAIRTIVAENLLGVYKMVEQPDDIPEQLTG